MDVELVIVELLAERLPLPRLERTVVTLVPPTVREVMEALVTF